MVGVAGRSKGCHLCRKRKIACTLERPVCYQCVKSKRVCPGYDRGTRFIIETKEGRERVGNAKLKPGRCEKGSKWEGDCNEVVTGSTIAKLAAGQNAAPDETPPYAFSDWRIFTAWSASLTVTAHSQQILANELVKDIPRSADHIGQGYWLSLILQEQCLTPALKKSLQAFSTAGLANTTKSSALSNYSLQLYTQALHELQKALRDPVAVYEDQTLAACIMAVLYEFRRCPGRSRRAYKSHCDGCARLVLARGPERHVSGLGHALFVNFRVIGSMQALLHRETFLKDEVWMRVPFSVRGKAPISRMTDALLAGSKLLDKGDQLGRLKDPVAEMRAAIDLWLGCRSLQDDLLRFKAKYESTDGLLFWEMPAKMVNLEEADDEDLTWPGKHFWFKDFNAARVMTLYWAISMTTLSGLSHLYFAAMKLKDEHPLVLEVAKEAGYDLDGMLVLGKDDDFLGMVHSIFKSVYYCLHGMPVDVGLLLVTAPLRMTFDTLKGWPQCERELKWAEAALKRIQEMGVGMIEYLGDT